MTVDKLFIAPHCDDETLFGSFILLREHPQVVIVMPESEDRKVETIQAMHVLGQMPPLFLDVPTKSGYVPVRDALKIFTVTGSVWAPAPEISGGNIDHNTVSRVATTIWPDAYLYTTYSQAGKSRTSKPIEPHPDWIRLKHLALACYVSQIEAPACREHFLRDIREYLC